MKVWGVGNHFQAITFGVLVFISTRMRVVCLTACCFTGLIFIVGQTSPSIFGMSKCGIVGELWNCQQCDKDSRCQNCFHHGDSLLSVKTKGCGTTAYLHICCICKIRLHAIKNIALIKIKFGDARGGRCPIKRQNRILHQSKMYFREGERFIYGEE